MMSKIETSEQMHLNINIENFKLSIGVINK